MISTTDGLRIAGNQRWSSARRVGQAIVLTLLILGGGSHALNSEHWIDPSEVIGLNGVRCEGEVALVFGGDVMLSRNVAKSIGRNNRDFTSPFAIVAQLTQPADVAFCNLESAISGRGQAIKKRYLFNAPPQAVEGLQHAGFDVVSLANNHILDYGPIAMEDTARIVKGRGILPVGLTFQDEPQEPALVERNGLRIAFLAYCDPVPGASYAREYYAFDKRPAVGNRSNIARDLAAIRNEVDLIIVSMHWGVEYQPGPNEHQASLGRFIIDQGAHVLAGHHQHVQQEPEVYKGALILHGMGNLVFDQRSRPSTRQSRLYRVHADRRGIVSAEYLPLVISLQDWTPRPTATAFIEVMRREDD
ncbi:MAG: hypothetical protein DRQ55_09125 [Planctomycetota bacterium]|nr:MAG: hypothetical protein DRQ55_09125 [Planctomycetota bacterium]